MHIFYYNADVTLHNEKMLDSLPGAMIEVKATQMLPKGCKSFVDKKKVIKAKHSDHQVELSKHFDCTTRNIVYIIECRKCGDQYIGQTMHFLKDRFLYHLGYARREEVEKVTGGHFNIPAHKL